MNKVEKAVYECMSDITGLDVESLSTIQSDNLFTSGVLDSLSLVSIMNAIEEVLDINIDFSTCTAENFLTINSIIDLLQSRFY